MPRDETVEHSGTRADRITAHDHLWTPWRMRYITGQAGEPGCIFCNRRGADDDVDALVLYRGMHAYIIMNLFPYNTGHVMIVPNLHAAALEELDDATLIEMAQLAPRVTAALRRVLRCDGFNLGLNLGAIAGAGVAEHLHQHVVPRWTGDANFMPILASTMVMPELIPATYAKIRAELERELLEAKKIAVVILAEGDTGLFLRDGAVPVAGATEGVPLWRSAMDLALDSSREAEIAGWAGSTLTGRRTGQETPAIVIRVGALLSGSAFTIVPVDRVLRSPPVAGVTQLLQSALRMFDHTSNSTPS